MLGFIASFILATLITPLLIKIYTKRGWVDDPKKQKHVKTTHKKAVPRGGGIVIFLAILIPALLLLQVDKYLIGILSASLLLTVVGFLDDIWDIHPFRELSISR